MLVNVKHVKRDDFSAIFSTSQDHNPKNERSTQPSELYVYEITFTGISLFS
jgi:hypothetical protein